MAAVGHAEENGYAELGIRTIKEEVALKEYQDLTSAKLRIGRFIDDVYCLKRIHSSLGYLTPAAVRGSMVRAVVVSYIFKQQFRVQFSGPFQEEAYDAI